MELLKKENWWVWLILFIFSGFTSTIVLGALLGSFDKNAWYAKWYIWVIGFILIIPFSIMSIVLIIQITANVASKLKVGGMDFYLSPYVWIILLIIPFLGWFIFAFLILYLNIAIIVKLYKGMGEEYIA